MGVAGPEPAMAGASAGSPIMPRARRAYALTAPPNLNGKKALTLKREAPTIWELQTAMAASEQVEAPTVRKLPVAPRTWGRAHSTAVESAALAESEGNMSVDCDGESRGGGSSSSWPRVRKQRTGVRNSMSLWEVSEALDGNAPQHPAVLPSPDTLDAHTLADLGDDLSFVDNMFFSHAPAPAPVSAPEDSMGMAALGVDLSRIRCSPKINGQGPSELPHHAPWTQPLSEEAALLPLPTPGSMPTAFDWAALAHDSPTSSEENQMSDAHTMPFAEHEASSVRDTPSSEVSGETLAHSESEALAMLKQIAGGEEARGVVAVRPPSLDMEQAMAMDPGELLASLLPDARGETAYGALPQPPAHMHAHAEPDTPRTATPPMVPLTAELPGAIAAPLGARVHGAAAGAGSVLPPAASLPGTAGLSSGLSAEHAQGAMPLSLVPAPLAAGSRNGPERKEWTTAEDEIIQNGVAMFGCKWRRIAAQLPGRSDDAVRNRWNRLKEARDGPPAEAAEGEAAAPAAARRRSSGGGRKVSADAPGEKAAAEGGAAKDKAKPERMSWTKAEDVNIVNGVHELGHKWYQIAQRLPGRTDHAIRNRYHRLQAMMHDQKMQAQQNQSQMMGQLPPLPEQ